MKLRRTVFISTTLAALMLAGAVSVSAADLSTADSAESSCSSSAVQDGTQTGKPARQRKSKTAAAENAGADSGEASAAK